MGFGSWIRRKAKSFWHGTKRVAKKIYSGSKTVLKYADPIAQAIGSDFGPEGEAISAGIHEMNEVVNNGADPMNTQLAQNATGKAVARAQPYIQKAQGMFNYLNNSKAAQTAMKAARSQGGSSLINSILQRNPKLSAHIQSLQQSANNLYRQGAANNTVQHIVSEFTKKNPGGMGHTTPEVPPPKSNGKHPRGLLISPAPSNLKKLHQRAHNPASYQANGSARQTSSQFLSGVTRQPRGPPLIMGNPNAKPVKSTGGILGPRIG